MSRKPREKKPGYSGKISINNPDNIFDFIKTKLPNIKTVFKSKNTTSVHNKNKKQRCEVWNCDISKLIKLLADIATNLWRARNRINAEELDNIPEHVRKAARHYEASWDLLINAGFEVCDHTNEPYAGGSDLKVVAFQPMPGYGTETVAETIKPTIYFKNQKIQKGEVIVAMPIKDSYTNEGNK